MNLRTGEPIIQAVGKLTPEAQKAIERVKHSHGKLIRALKEAADVDIYIHGTETGVEVTAMGKHDLIDSLSLNLAKKHSIRRMLINVIQETAEKLKGKYPVIARILNPAKRKPLLKNIRIAPSTANIKEIIC